MANKKRLIDADEALLNTYNEIYWTESEAAAVRSFLVHQKSVDAVEVVRCRECKHFKPKINEKGRMSCVCTNEAIGFFEWMMCENDFCSYGERKDNG